MTTFVKIAFLVALGLLNVALCAWQGAQGNYGLVALNIAAGSGCLFKAGHIAGKENP